MREDARRILRDRRRHPERAQRAAQEDEVARELLEKSHAVPDGTVDATYVAVGTIEELGLTVARAGSGLTIRAAERDERIVDQRGRSGRSGAGDAEEGVEQPRIDARLDVADDEDQPRAVVVVGPVRRAAPADGTRAARRGSPPAGPASRRASRCP